MPSTALHRESYKVGHKRNPNLAQYKITAWVTIKPSEVRLTPRATDIYAWQPVQGKEEIFSEIFVKIFTKRLSDNSSNRRHDIKAILLDVWTAAEIVIVSEEKVY
ncbi:unnamed protein product [Fusarium graminearum]|nr:unnamed protein product [Fusarium graminearum]